ncbi:protein RETICULATA-RELATED 3, chloroplastic-like [Andrographis paniculata]|uniref:protein RETICULATA-RELATED 3, chloroplastic-like n=1 Tax=Andrographis paniculata TaxID=175694 RepID=UPI0021E71254|nr:protein RETICULATA-RELATED 3, chloroplastic-like [Andrographis paniculata]XP_051131152.1 protein RETICULATA-RELATED 3, chloroplastic-like [Andrographis paniculata]
MSTAAQLRYSPLSGSCCRKAGVRPVTYVSGTFADNTFRNSVSFPSLKCSGDSLLNPNLQSKFPHPCAGGGGGDIGIGRSGGSGNGGSGGWSSGGDSDESKSSSDGFGPIGAFLSGWRSRVAADPQFPFKVLMEELVGVTSCVLGDMASRPNFGLNELDFVFSTLVVGSILNFTLMYLLAPTLSASVQTLPGIFASSPTSHMFEPGSYSLLSRLGTFVYKGTVFAAVGFGAGLVGTAISNGLITMRKKMDPNFETPNKPPPTILNALTWAAHMGLSSNFRYQTLNGVEFVLEKGFPPALFKSSVVVLRCLNNILGGMSFVILARMTGSQSVDGGKTSSIKEELSEEKEKLVSEVDNLQASTSSK